MKKLRAVDLFCGAGGFALGLKRAGIEIVKSLDHDLAALAVHSANLENAPGGRLPGSLMQPPWRPGQKRPPRRGHLSGSGRVVQKTDLLDVLDHGPEMAMLRPDIIVGGPPCQPYSRAGKQLGDSDWRSALTEAFAMMIACGRPRYFVMENVPAVKNSRAYGRARGMFRALGYGLTETEIDASFYGTAQGRKRWICAGVLNGADGWLHEYLEQYSSRRRITVADELGPEFGVTLDDITIPGRERISQVQPAKEGGETRLKDRDVELVLGSGADDRFYFSRPGGPQTGNIRLTRKPGPTITGKSTQGVGKNYRPRPVDWIDLRKLAHPTFEEFSRLGGFPPDWEWDVAGYRTVVNGFIVQSDPPSQTDIKQMLGNAVAPPLAECIGRAIIDHSSGRKPEARAAKSLREGTGEPVEKEQEPFAVPDRYSAWLEARRPLTPKALGQELSNLKRAKREVAAWALVSTREETAALDRVLAVSLASLNASMKSSLRRALGDFADWEDQETEKKALRKRQRQQALRAKEDEEHQARELEESRTRPVPRFITERRMRVANGAAANGPSCEADVGSRVPEI